MFAKVGFTEILIILIVGFLVFGPKKLPELGKTFGNTINQFKKASKGDFEDEGSDQTKKELEGNKKED